MEDWKQFIKNLIGNNYFFTKVTNPEEVSSPIVKAIKDKEIPVVDPEDISAPIVDAISEMQKSSDKNLEAINNSLNKPEDTNVKEVEVSLKGIDIVAIKGEKGDKPSDDELINLIKPLIPEPKKGDKGDSGKDYKLTATDKKEIAKSIKVPVVEKVIEKTEVIVEKPIITNEIKEVAVGDEPIVLKDKLETLEGDDRLDAKAIKNLPVHTGGGIQRIDDALDTDIDNPTNGQSLVYNSDTKQWENGTVSVSGTGIVETIVAGANVTVDATDPANPIVSASLPSGSGIIRSVVITSGNYTASATAGTDYEYLIAGAHTTTLPTAVGNSNKYTFKNNHSANVTINPAGAQTIDGAASLSLGPQEAIDLTSDNTSNWNIS